MLNAGIKNRRTKETKDNAEKKTKTHTYGQPTNVPKPTTEQATRKESKEDWEEKPEPAGINKQNKTRDQEKETEKDKKIVYEQQGARGISATSAARCPTTFPPALPDFP